MRASLGHIPHVILSKLLPVSLAMLAGCYGPGAREVWDYRWHGRATNLIGFRADDHLDTFDPFLTPVWRVLRRDSRGLVVVFQTDNPPTSLLLAFERHNVETSGEWVASTTRRTLRAWLVRAKTQTFERMRTRPSDGINWFNWIDEGDLLAVADRASTSLQRNPVPYPMLGDARIRIKDSANCIDFVKLHLRTADPIQGYRDYVQNSIFVLQATRGMHGDPLTDDRTIRDLQADLDQPHAPAPATVDGTFLGGWVTTGAITPM